MRIKLTFYGGETHEFKDVKGFYRDKDGDWIVVNHKFEEKTIFNDKQKDEDWELKEMEVLP